MGRPACECTVCTCECVRETENMLMGIGEGFGSTCAIK